MRKNLISIIVPVYNVAEYIEKCFESISKQTYENLEVIVVDDGSIDASGRICDEYAKKDSRFIVIHKENEGVSKARNVGLSVAQGEYIGFVDSDDTIDEDMYEVLYSNLILKNADISICNYTKVLGNKTLINLTETKELVYSCDAAIKEVLLDRCFIGSVWNKLFKKNVVRELFFLEDIYYAEDKIFVIQAFLNSTIIVFDPVSKYNYYERENSAVTRKFDEKTYTLHTAHEIIIETLITWGKEELIGYAYTALLICDIVLLGKVYYAKDERDVYSKYLQKSIKNNFKLSRKEELKFFQKIGVISAYLSIKLFFLLFSLKEKIKKQ